MRRVIKIFEDYLEDVKRQNQGKAEATDPIVLVAEDEDFDRMQLEMFLKTRQCVILPCHTGYEAMDTIKNNERIDLAFLDLKLPGPSGVDIMRRLKQTYPHIYVVVITGSVNPDLLEEARKVGHFGIVFKPLEEKDVHDILDRHTTLPPIRPDAAA